MEALVSLYLALAHFCIEMPSTCPLRSINTMPSPMSSFLCLLEVVKWPAADLPRISCVFMFLPLVRISVILLAATDTRLCWQEACVNSVGLLFPQLWGLCVRAHVRIFISRDKPAMYIYVCIWQESTGKRRINLEIISKWFRCRHNYQRVWMWLWEITSTGPEQWFKQLHFTFLVNSWYNVYLQMFGLSIRYLNDAYAFDSINGHRGIQSLPSPKQSCKVFLVLN
jgi:hypothetical protein